MVQCLSLAGDISAGELTGAWLASYDPEGCGGLGEALWTHDQDQAAVFTDEEWAALYHVVPASRPLRPDGKPNRPITRFTVLLVPATRTLRPRPPEPAPEEPVSLADEMRAMGLM